VSGSDHSKAVCKLFAHPTMGRFLTKDAKGRPVIDRAKVKAEERLDGKYLVVTSDDTLTPEDVALGYKQLTEIERSWREMKSGLDAALVPPGPTRDSAGRSAPSPGSHDVWADRRSRQCTRVSAHGTLYNRNWGERTEAPVGGRACGAEFAGGNGLTYRLLPDGAPRRDKRHFFVRPVGH
jgi:hypothetical protein